MSISVSYTVRRADDDPRDLEIAVLRALVKKQEELIASQNHLIGVQDQLLIKVGLTPQKRKNV